MRGGEREISVCLCKGRKSVCLFRAGNWRFVIEGEREIDGRMNGIVINCKSVGVSQGLRILSMLSNYKSQVEVIKKIKILMLCLKIALFDVIKIDIITQHADLEYTFQSLVVARKNASTFENYNQLRGTSLNA